MKVAIFKSEVFWTPHFGTGLEIMEDHLSKGDEVYSFTCDSELKLCDQNLEANPDKCKLCIKKRELGYQELSNKVSKINIELSKEQLNLVKANMSVNDVKNINYDNYDVGMASISSVVSRKRDAYLDVKANLDLLNDLINTAVSLYDFFIQQLKLLMPDKVYVFSGRLIYDKSLLRACEKLSITYVVFERGSSADKYMLYEKGNPHDINNTEQLIGRLWDNPGSELVEKVEIGESFYEDRSRGTITGWHNFTSEQNISELPGNWDSKKRNIVIFLSSEDEFLAIGKEWEMNIYKDQYDGLSKLKQGFKNNPEISIYVRVHPNSQNTSAKLLSKIDQLEASTFGVIKAESSISTYLLLKECDVAVSFGSTVGIEASFWGKPSICLGKCYYVNLGVTHNPSTHQEVMDLISDKNIEAIQSDNILKYGYYFKSFGMRYKYFKSNGVSGGSFGSAELEKYGYHSFGAPITRKKVVLRTMIKFVPNSVKIRLKRMLKKKK